MQQFNLAPDKVADPGLSDTEELRCSSLGETFLVDDRSDNSHQRGSYLEVLSFLLGEAQILEDVACRMSDLPSHVVSSPHACFWRR